MHKIKESGRSLLEMIAVLAIIAIILIASLFMVNNLFKYYQRKDTIKQINTIVTHYRSDKLVRRRNGVIKLNDILPKAMTNELVQPNGDKLILEDKENSDVFMVIAEINNLSCQDVVQERNYDGVSKNPEKEEVYTPEEAVEEKVLKEICDGRLIYFIYGKDKPVKCNYYVDGNCSECPSGQKKDSKGECCEETRIECGICGGCGAGLHCFGTTCVECKDNDDCAGKPEKKHLCDPDTHKCEQCIEVGKHCPGEFPAGEYCDSQKECKECKGECKDWQGTECIDSNGIAEIEDDCTRDCECKGGASCVSGKCACPEPKEWNPVSKQCECPAADDPNKDNDCYEIDKPYDICPEYYHYIPKAENTPCGEEGECRACNASGMCEDRSETWTGRIYDSTNTNCCLESATYTYCPLKGESAPTTTCTEDVTKPRTSYGECEDVVEMISLCHVEEVVSSTKAPKNEGEKCGTCGTCSAGDCINDSEKETHTYYKDVGGECVQVSEEFCPGEVPPSQCKTCSECTECQKCDITEGECVADTTKNGTNHQADGKCCFDGQLQHNDTYCPAPTSPKCVPLKILAEEHMTSNYVEVEGIEYPLYHLSYKGTISKEFDIDLLIEAYSIWKSPSPKIKITGPGLNINKSYDDLDNHFNGAAWGKDFDETITLKGGGSYNIDIDIYLLCDMCLLDTSCAFYE